MGPPDDDDMAKGVEMEGDFEGTMHDVEQKVRTAPCRDIQRVHVQ